MKEQSSNAPRTLEAVSTLFQGPDTPPHKVGKGPRIAFLAQDSDNKLKEGFRGDSTSLFTYETREERVVERFGASEDPEQNLGRLETSEGGLVDASVGPQLFTDSALDLISSSIGPDEAIFGVSCLMLFSADDCWTDAITTIRLAPNSCYSSLLGL